MRVTVGRVAVLRFRLYHHGLLGERAPRGDLGVAPLGLPDVDHGGAAAALAVRADLGDETLADVVEEGRLVPTYGARAAGALARPDDLHYVSHALLRPDLRSDADAALVDRLATAALRALREHGPMTKEQLGEAIASDTPPEAMRSCERCGRDHPDDGLVKRLAWSGRLRIEHAERCTDRVAAAGRWRPARHRRVRDQQRVELVRRFLRLHGPATVEDLAAWAGIDDGYASACWSLVSDDLVAVSAPHGDGWVDRADLDLLRDPPPASSPRLVPGYDPLLQTRQRHSLVADRAQQRRIWRSTANPGVVIAHDEIAGTWRARTSGGRLDVRLRSFGAELPAQELEADASAVARARGLHGFAVSVDA